MKKTILFSPVGGTDPIKYFRDGSMLHICRHYKPDVVYLYLSHEMMECHRKDDRYRDAIHRLGEYLEHSFTVHIIDRDDLIDVQQYDVFYRDFREEIIKIEDSMEPEDKLLLNMASGTPAMKSALLVMATFAEYRFQPIQVATPQRSMNVEYEDRKGYDKEVNWELNEDNQEDAPNRCTEVKSMNLVKMIQMKILEKHVQSYDYSAALTVASQMREELPEDAYTLLQIMDARVKLNRQAVSKLLEGKTYKIYPIAEGDKQKLFEYALVLQMKIRKQEYADFIRGITPLIVDLLENILKNQCGININDYCSYYSKHGSREKKNETIRRWDEKKIKHTELLDIFNRAYDRDGFQYGNVYSDHIVKIIEQKCGDTDLKKRVREMREIEEKVRNMAAHEIVSVTDEWIQDRTGKSIKDIFELIQYLIGKSGIHAKKEDWRSYDRINEKIILDLV